MGLFVQLWHWTPRNICSVVSPLPPQIQDAKGDVTITNDGATILKQMQVLHPAAKMVKSSIACTMIRVRGSFLGQKNIDCNVSCGFKER